MTTRWKDFVSALTSLRVPGAVITITTLAYRYIFLLAKLLLDSMHARRSRLAGDLGLVESWKEAGKHMGATFIKANSLGEEVYYAMLARGYSNETLRSEGLKIEKTDYALAVFTLILLALAVVTTEVFR
jgi:cobalt/nickel transport system permease protein